jgi:hypothetical protein
MIPILLGAAVPGAVLPGGPLPPEFAGLVLPGYTLLSLLGRGGMGVVFLARQQQLDRYVAVKMLSPSVEWGVEGLRRLHAEALTLAALSHPNIVSCHDMLCQGEHLFVIMDYVPGQLTVGDVSVQYGPLAEPQAVQIILQAARGLAYCQGKGVVHRDIKPGNLLVFHDLPEPPATVQELLDHEQTRVVIADFGLARYQPAPVDSQVTVENVIVGTPAYMAPEQALGQPADYRADIYALGATHYRLLTGHDPFATSTWSAALRARLTSDFPQVDQFGVPISPACREVLQRMTARAPADRYQDYRTLLRDLEGLARPTAHSRGPRTWRRRWLAIAAALVLLLGGGAVGFLALAPPRHPMLSQSLAAWSQAGSGWTVAPADDAVPDALALVCTAAGNRLALRHPLPAEADCTFQLRLPDMGQAEVFLLHQETPVWSLRWSRLRDANRLQAGLIGRWADVQPSFEKEPEEWCAVRLAVDARQVVLYIDGQLAGYTSIEPPVGPLTPAFELADGPLVQVQDVRVGPRKTP